MVDKVIISNQAALASKYASAGLASIQAVLNALIAADAARGLTTKVVFIDDATAMAAAQGAPVAGPADERGAKAAVDAVFNAFSPAYVLLLDGPDVVPHITLDQIPGLGDGDLNIPSDLPYASPAGWSTRASDFLAVTRVVGRLPAPRAETSADPLVGLLSSAAARAPQPAANFNPPFAISAAVWSQSTQLSANNAFGPGQAVDLAPPADPLGIISGLGRLAHFINCHGAEASDQFYGQQGNQYPVAMASAQTSPHLRPGVIAAAECCFGAELYDYHVAGTAQPICMAYLSAGASAFLGSTNIAYGPSAGNGQADLLAQYFMAHVLAGASTGRACLQARQDFVRTQTMSDPSNLKTIAQFVLLGDPSIQPCEAAAPKSLVAVGIAEQLDEGSERKMRRIALHGTGLAIEATASRPGRRARPSEDLAKQLRAVAERRGISAERMNVMRVTGGRLYRASAKALDGERKVATLVDVNAPSEERRWASIRVLTAHIVDDRIVRVEETERR